MSWFYDALQRAEKERSRSGNGSDPSVSSPGGESFLTAIEALSSMATPAAAPPAAEMHAATAVMAPTPTKLAEQVVVVATEVRPTLEVQPAREAAEKPIEPARARAMPAEKPGSVNGYRHLSLPASEESRLVFHTEPHGLAAEQFRLLRRTLSQQFSKGGVLMITSPAVGDGKTLTSLNLCASLGDAGGSTLLMEVDVRRPSVRKTLGCPIELPGIEDVYAGTAEPAEAVHVIDDLSFHAAIVSRAPRDPSRLINGGGLKKFLGWARERYKWIVLDAAPVLPAADVTDLLPLVDAVMLIVRAQGTPRELSKRAIELLGKRLHGIILNEATMESSPYYRYLSHYYAEDAAKTA